MARDLVKIDRNRLNSDCCAALIKIAIKHEKYDLISFAVNHCVLNTNVPVVDDALPTEQFCRFIVDGKLNENLLDCVDAILDRSEMTPDDRNLLRSKFFAV
ncbi:hypothetical protein GEMRC1_002673 [Eukaryota sp. GEM-RC1]